jgi:hypothetical protein
MRGSIPHRRCSDQCMLTFFRALPTQFGRASVLAHPYLLVFIYHLSPCTGLSIGIQGLRRMYLLIARSDTLDLRGMVV